MYTKDSKDYERLYSLDILGVEDRGGMTCLIFTENSMRTFPDKVMEDTKSTSHGFQEANWKKQMRYKAERD